MAVNLRLRPEVEAALRAEAERSGRSQQDLLREAVDRYLGLTSTGGPTTDREVLIATGLVRPPRTEYRKVRPHIALPPDITSLDLLDRDDRV
jgi:hypothetical protein